MISETGSSAFADQEVSDQSRQLPHEQTTMWNSFQNTYARKLFFAQA
jgi:hypothetical protein